MNERLLGGKIK